VGMWANGRLWPLQGSVQIINEKMKTLITIAGIPTEIRIEYLMNTSRLTGWSRCSPLESYLAGATLGFRSGHRPL
jgi:hypothetical protein